MFLRGSPRQLLQPEAEMSLALGQHPGLLSQSGMVPFHCCSHASSSVQFDVSAASFKGKIESSPWMIINFFRSCEKVSGYVYMIVDVIKLFSEGMHILRPAIVIGSRKMK